MKSLTLRSSPSSFWGRRLLALAAGICLLTPAVRAQSDDWEDAASYQRSNSRILAAFRPAVARPARSTVRILCDDRSAVLGTIVGEDGWILTKASELKGEIVCRLPDGRDLPARVVRENEKYDLALLKVQAQGLQPVRWWESGTAPVGNWVASPGPSGNPLAIGVVSVAARKIPQPKYPFEADLSRSGYLGIGLAPDTDAAKVGKVMPNTAAARAGLKVNDVIVAVAGKETHDSGSLLATLQGYKPGEVVKVRIKRDDEEMELKVKLGRRPPDRSDFQNHLGSELSQRRRGFPTILQHDTVLKPSDCGGPLVDLDGDVIGINIARAGRTESYALPAETVIPLLRDLSAGKLRPVLVRKGDEGPKEVRSAKVSVGDEN